MGPSLSRPLLLRSTGSRRAGSVIVAHGPSCSEACGIFPDHGSNPCPLHSQADSQPLHHQGSPKQLFWSLCLASPISQFLHIYFLLIYSVPLNEPSFLISLRALWFYVENWTLEPYNVVTLQIRFSLFPRVCCLLTVIRISLRWKFKVFSGFFWAYDSSSALTVPL